MNDLAARQAALAQAILQHVGTDNRYDLQAKDSSSGRAVTNTDYQFATDGAKQKAFSQWLQAQLDSGVLGIVGSTDPDQPPGAQYIASAYKQGLIRAYEDAHRADLAGNPELYQQSRAKFLASSFGTPEALAKVEALYTRAFEDMKGLTAYEKQQLGRTLADAMANGFGADQTARNMVDQIDSITRTRANTLARTELVRAHAEGQLDAFQDMGIEELGIEAEWATADDDAVCEDCQSMAEDSPYTVDEARGLIPYHPNCRCAWVPVEQESKRQTAADRIKAYQDNQPDEQDDSEEANVPELDLTGGG